MSSSSTMIDPNALQQFHASAVQQRQHQRNQFEQQQQQQTTALPHTPTKPSPSSSSSRPPPHSPASPQVAQHHNTSPTISTPTKQYSPASSSSSAASSSSTTPTRRPPPPRYYRNEEVLLFRVPGDTSNLVLFNLPSRPFIHAYYDLKTVAKARKDADEAMRIERGEIIPPPAADEAAAASSDAAAAASSTSIAAPTPVVPLPRPPPAIASAPTSAAASSSASSSTSNSQSLAISYHAMHLQNIERVLHSIAAKFGLVYEITVQCKKRDAPSATSSRPPFHDFDETPSSPIEAFEQSYTLWAFIKYYSMLHAAVAVKELNRITLGSGPRLRAKMTEARVRTKVEPTTKSTGGDAFVDTSADERRPYFPLAYHRCLELCNYFLGFNNWNCEIKEIRRYDPMKDEELMDDLQAQGADYRQSLADRFRYSWTATVLVNMAGQSFLCSGVGHSERVDDRNRAKKKAVTNAYRQLFASLAFVILHNGKVAVQILP